MRETAFSSKNRGTPFHCIHPKGFKPETVPTSIDYDKITGDILINILLDD